MAMKHRLVAGTMLLAGGALAGGVVAGTMSANAADGSGTSSTAAPAPSSSRTAGPQGDHDGDGPAGGPAGGGHAGETVVTGSKAATLKAAALKAVPGATVDRVETDSGDAAYEVHLTEADGSQVTVKFDQSLEKTAVETGMGT